MNRSADRELITKIVEEVLQRLQTEDLMEKQKPLLYIFASGAEPSALQQVTLTCRPYFEICVVKNEQSDIFQDSTAQVLFMNVDQDLIVRGALGLTDTPQSLALAKALHGNLPITMLLSKVENEVYSTKTAYKEYLLNQKIRLETFGVRITSLKDLKGELDIDAKERNPDKSLLQNKLLTENDINAANRKELRINKETIVTPLAWDAARKQGIRIMILDE
ncbi:hypothetical protein [Fictibacillus fluitans]|uniref:Ethanolamine utilization protein n=1 Tax=Fictibacillus fluitans TaxID=3058422 RepID=A0ABT8I0T9_9BACL|nr:hypothetical protein [Fictibacillus sp. NE201]MDN4526630.1 hypothetical protein [Fictibacillus sp. NE201]